MNTRIPKIFLDPLNLDWEGSYINYVPTYPANISPLVTRRRLNRVDGRLQESWKKYKNAFYFYHHLNTDLFQMKRAAIFAESKIPFNVDPNDYIFELKNVESVNESFIVSRNGDIKHYLQFDIIYEKMSQIEKISKEIASVLDGVNFNGTIRHYEKMKNIDRKCLNVILDDSKERINEPARELLFQMATSKIPISELRSYNARTKSKQKKLLESNITSLLPAMDTFFVSGTIVLEITLEEYNEKRHHIEKLIRDNDMISERIIMAENQLLGAINFFIECGNTDEMITTLNYFRDNYQDLKPVFSLWRKRTINAAWIRSILNKRVRIG